jgi:hypothetical protein
MFSASTDALNGKHAVMCLTLGFPVLVHTNASGVRHCDYTSSFGP